MVVYASSQIWVGSEEVRALGTDYGYHSRGRDAARTSVM